MHKKNWKPITRYAMRFDGEGGGGSSAPAATATPATPVTPASPTPENQPPATPATPFKTFASEADYQKDLDFKVQQALKTHEEKLKGKLTPEIRKQLEAEANMTAEQKVQAQLDQLESQKKELAKERVRIKVESLFASKGISEADRLPMLDSIVDDNEEESLKRGQALIDAIDRATNEKIKEAMTKVKVPGTSAGAKETTQPNDTIGKILGHQFAEARKGASKAIDYYKVGGNRS